MYEYSLVNGEEGEILNKNFTTCFRKGYVRLKETILPVYYLKFAERIKEMKIRDDDIWVCSFPKTGTTWTQEMVWCIASDLDFEGAKVALPRRFPFLDHTPLFDYEDVLPKHPDMILPDFVTNSISYINNMPSPRFIKTHLPFELLPQQLQDSNTKAKIVYVARNPKDTCLSYFHHSKLMEGYVGNFNEFAKLFLNNALCFSPFPKNVLSYWNRRNKPNILFLKYEDMKSDLKSVIKQTANYLNKKFNETQISLLMNHLSFESMKNNRSVNYEEVVEINRTYKLIEADGSFMRSGQTGQWKGSMEPELIEKFDKWTKEHFKNSGLEF